METWKWFAIIGGTALLLGLFIPPLSYLFGKYFGRGLAAANKPKRERDQDGTP